MERVKAWVGLYDDDDPEERMAVIVFADTRGRGRALALREFDEPDFTRRYVRVRRASVLDQYSDEAGLLLVTTRIPALDLVPRRHPARVRLRLWPDGHRGWGRPRRRRAHVAERGRPPPLQGRPGGHAAVGGRVVGQPPGRGGDGAAVRARHRRGARTLRTADGGLTPSRESAAGHPRPAALSSCRTTNRGGIIHARPAVRLAKGRLPSLHCDPGGGGPGHCGGGHRHRLRHPPARPGGRVLDLVDSSAGLQHFPGGSYDNRPVPATVLAALAQAATAPEPTAKSTVTLTGGPWPSSRGPWDSALPDRPRSCTWAAGSARSARPCGGR